jgi:hypothetical protein
VLRILNACRLYLQVIFVSDITTASGEEIEEDIKKGRRMIDRESRLQWPTQQRPPRQAWKQWQDALKYLENGTKLKQPLGDWISAPHQEWKWFLCQEDNELYELSCDEWKHYPKHQRDTYHNTRATSRVKYSNYSFIVQPPTGTLLPVSIKQGGTTSTTDIEITISGNPFPPAEEPRVQQHLETRGGRLTPHPYYKYLLDQMENLIMERLPEIGEAIRYSDLYVCSDGAHNHSNKLGSHAWVFSTAAGEVLWCGAGPTIGHVNMTSPGRSELSGITALLLLLHWICMDQNISSGQVTLFCDNKKSIRYIFDEALNSPLDQVKPDMDLIISAKDILRLLPIKVKHEWVKGHYKGPDRAPQHDINELADEVAKDYNSQRRRAILLNINNLLSPCEEVALQSEDVVITSNMKKVIEDNIHLDPLKEKIMRDTRWSESTFQSVDWTIHEQALMKKSRFERISIVKLIHGLYQTNGKNERF